MRGFVKGLVQTECSEGLGWIAQGHWPHCGSGLILGGNRKIIQSLDLVEGMF